jgi:hypothetical protein
VLNTSDAALAASCYGAKSAELNREMFIFRLDDGAWKIARYMFNQPR